jgi:hypothetical protein
MSEYQPDKFVVLKITFDKSVIYKVFGSWYGGFAGRDSWQMNSGIKYVVEWEEFFEFYGYSGSCYTCYKSQYGTSVYSHSVLTQLIENSAQKSITIEVLPEDYPFETIVGD